MEGRQSTGINTDKEKCAHCREMYPLQYVMSHEVLCEANPANQHFLAILELCEFIPNLREKHDPAPVLIEDEGSNLIIVIGKEKFGKTTIINRLIGEDGDFENSPRSCRKYVFMEPSYEDKKNIMSGLCLADFALVVIDSSMNFQKTYLAADFLEPCSLAKAFGFKKLLCSFSKMYLVHYSEEQYIKLRNEAAWYLCELGFSVLCIKFVPTAALEDENVTERQGCLGWYMGSTSLKQFDRRCCILL
ncbi:unnamed protein product [Cuscuta campestris]|uniref:G domain-containing protein n=1 Tax=Cuscuta campestris TaxID=132261 RepID=A0A484LZY0_9ASTE|nr:unnamed protein product [Cuscuta campestris]